jgi:hypothetical protein
VAGLSAVLADREGGVFMTLPWPKKGSKLFVDGGEYHEFSHFGWGSVDTQFYGYMEGYKKSADELIDLAVNSGDIKTLDTYIFPICFLYRQYLELAMKYIFIKYSGWDKDKKISAIKDVNHNLLRIWNKIKPIILEETTKEEKEDIEAVEDYISQFNIFDKSSFTFRYPITKELDGVLTKERRINLINLKERMDELYCFFDGCTGKLDEISEYKAEMLSEYLSYMDDYDY